MDPDKEEEDKATPLGCEEENLVEEKATLVSLWEDGKVENMDNESSDFWRIHVHLKLSDPWKYKKYSLAFEDCKRKANCEGGKFAPSFPVGDHIININKREGVIGDNMVNEYFGSYPKE